MKLVIVLLGLALSGCGVMIGTPDYWEQYNQSIRRGQLETLTQADRSELDSVVRRVGR